LVIGRIPASSPRERGLEAVEVTIGGLTTGKVILALALERSRDRGK